MVCLTTREATPDYRISTGRPRMLSNMGEVVASDFLSSGFVSDGLFALPAALAPAEGAGAAPPEPVLGAGVFILDSGRSLSGFASASLRAMSPAFRMYSFRFLPAVGPSTMPDAKARQLTNEAFAKVFSVAAFVLDLYVNR